MVERFLRDNGRNQMSAERRLPDAARRQFLGLSTLLAAGIAMPKDLMAADPPLPQRGLCAHRGAMGTHPENTLPALEEALRLGAQMIEFDVRLTRDGALVLMHDDRVERTTDGDGRVEAMTLERVRQLDAGIRKDRRFAGTRVPTLGEALAMMPRDRWLNCHLKGGAELGAAAARAVVQAGRRHQAFLAATADAARAARAFDPEILICNMERQDNPAEYVAQTIAMKTAFIQLVGNGEVDEEQVRRLKANGVRVNYYRAGTPEAARRLFRAGVDFPLVNDLARFLAMARQLGIEPLRH